jgi:AcrR family transcriptional regulator
MDETTAPRLPGRQAEAARNDDLILDAARAVFLADANAPIAAVAERAGVGIGALYRRYRSKEDLLTTLYLDNLHRYLAETETALADDGDPWDAFCRYMHRSLDAGLGSLSVRFTGAFPLTDEIERLFKIAEANDAQIIERVKAAEVLRDDITGADILQFFHIVQLLHYDDAERSRQLRHRYLSLFLTGIHSSSAAMPANGPPLSWDEFTVLLEQKTRSKQAARGE